jgi:hypothetical protein
MACPYESQVDLELYIVVLVVPRLIVPSVGEGIPTVEGDLPPLSPNKFC